MTHDLTFVARTSAAMALVLACAACGGDQKPPSGGAVPASPPGGAAAPATPAATATPDTASALDIVEDAEGQTPTDEQAIVKPWTGDLDQMIERRYIRILCTFNRTNYFLDKAEQRGVTFEAGKAFEA